MDRLLFLSCRISHLDKFNFNPENFEKSLIIFKARGISELSPRKIVVSSASCDILICLSWIVIPLMGCWFIILLKTWATTKKRNAEIGQPCRMPRFISNRGDVITTYYLRRLMSVCFRTWRHRMTSCACTRGESNPGRESEFGTTLALGPRRLSIIWTNGTCCV